MADALKELARFQKERKLHERPFDKEICVMNIMEELLELYGVNDNKESRILASNMTYLLKRIVVDAELGEYTHDGITIFNVTEETEIDALCDIQVFAGGDVMKLGYSNAQCLGQVAMEINSRTGEIINGKFQKYTTDSAKALWYEADFSDCKL